MRLPHNRTPTSRAAADQIEPVSGKARATVLEYLRSRDKEGATADEIEEGTGISGNTVRPRVFELRQMGLVEDSKTTRPTRSGRRAAVWVAI
jgi:predicted ArsR family transcriptional regulator